MLFKSIRVTAGGGGAGKFRGSPGAEVIYGPRKDPMTVVVSCDGQVNPPRGVRGGQAGPAAATYKVATNGTEEKLPGIVETVLAPGETLRGVDAGGGGYGNPLERDPERVLKDVLENWETMERAYDVYGVVLNGDLMDESLSIDLTATERRRTELAV